MQNDTKSQPAGVIGGTKTCSKCRSEKPLTDFSVRKHRGVVGPYPSCKACQKVDSAEYYAKNSEKVKARVKLYAQENPQKIKAVTRARYLKDPAAAIAKTSAWAKANKDRANAQKAKWLERNPEKRKQSANGYYQRNAAEIAVGACKKYWTDPKKYNAATRAWQAKNRDKVRETGRAWRQKNPGMVAAACARRRTRLRLMPWCNQAEITEFYKAAKRLGGDCVIEVDHIYPLRGATVSGLHVVANLRAVPAVVNRSKGNKLPGFLSHELWDPNSFDVFHESEVHHG